MKQLEIEFHSWGGARDGAGRKRRPGRRASVAHRPRERHARAHPVHVTLRGRRGLPPFRERVLFRAIRARIAAANAAADALGAFRVIQFSVQSDHIHLIVEADDGRALARGMQGFAIRVARAINGLLRARGRVWGDRYHSRELATPRAVRNALVYVLMNGKKHGAVRTSALDGLSSAPWFGGFAEQRDAATGSPLRAPRTWLAGVGWRRGGLIRFDVQPRAPR